MALAKVFGADDWVCVAVLHFLLISGDKVAFKFCTEKSLLGLVLICFFSFGKQIIPEAVPDVE